MLQQEKENWLNRSTLTFTQLNTKQAQTPCKVFTTSSHAYLPT